MNPPPLRANPVVFIISAALLGLGGCTVYEPAPRREVVYVSRAPELGIEPSNTVYIESVNDFETPLNPYGEWVVVESYDRCWRPSRVGQDWRPYSNGQWVHSDAGWCWQSEEPWGWATYHYGRWDFLGSYGWIWVPETRWAPAWVEWRSGGGYIGWAPLRPDHRPRHYAESRHMESDYVFVHEGHFVEPVRPRNIVVNNTTIINKTVNITNTTVINNTVINQGPRVETVERVSGHRVNTVPAASFRHTQEASVAAEHPALAREHRDAPAQRHPTERSLPNPGNPSASPATRASEPTHRSAPTGSSQTEPSTGRAQPVPHAPAAPSLQPELPPATPPAAPDHRNSPPVAAQPPSAPTRREAHPAPPKNRHYEKQPKKQPEREDRQPVPTSPAPAPSPAP